MKAVPLRKMELEGRMTPSVSLKVVSLIDSTMMGGRSESSRMLRKLEGEGRGVDGGECCSNSIIEWDGEW